MTRKTHDKEDTEFTLLKMVSIQMCATNRAKAVYGPLANVMFVCFNLKMWYAGVKKNTFLSLQKPIYSL